MSNQIISFEIESVNRLEFDNLVNALVSKGVPKDVATSRAKMLYHVTDKTPIQELQVSKPSLPPAVKTNDPSGTSEEYKKKHLGDSYKGGIYEITSSWLINAYIRKLPSGQYGVYSKSGKSMGKFDSRKKALKRLRQVEYFKHAKASIGDRVLLQPNTIYVVAFRNSDGSFNGTINTMSFEEPVESKVVFENDQFQYVAAQSFGEFDYFQIKKPVVINPDQLELDLGMEKKENMDIIAEDKDYDKELSMGEKVEEEHAGTIKTLLKDVAPDLSDSEVQEILAEAVVLIAKDHLKEMSDYYSKLKVMEDSSNEKVKGAEEKSQDVNEPVRKDNFNLFNTDMPDACPTDVFTKGYNTVEPPDSGDEPMKLFK